MNPSDLRVLDADERDRPVLERLWTMFRHDMSAVTGALPDEQGRFRQERLDAALDDPAWAAHLFRLGTSAIGFAVVRGIDADERVISSFFVAHGARRSGVGRVAVGQITRRHPGPWAVAFQDDNVAASRFWPAVAASLDPGWALDHRAVPGRSDLPPDAWVRFAVR